MKADEQPAPRYSTRSLGEILEHAAHNLGDAVARIRRLEPYTAARRWSRMLSAITQPLRPGIATRTGGAERVSLTADGRHPRTMDIGSKWAVAARLREDNLISSGGQTMARPWV